MTPIGTQLNPAATPGAAAPVAPARPAAPAAAAAPAPAAPAPGFAATAPLAASQGKPSTFGLPAWNPPAPPAAPSAPTAATPATPSYADAFGNASYVKNPQDATLNAMAKAVLAKSPELAGTPLARAVEAGRMDGAAVSALQEHLRSKGYGVGATGVDGKYGPNTHQGLTNFLAGKPADTAPQAPATADREGDATPPADARPLNDPSKFHISQYRGASNPNEDTARNGNCGPVSTLMALKGLGLVDPSPAQVDGMVEDLRRRGGATREERVGHNSGTSTDQLAKAARSFGADAQAKSRASLKDVEAALQNGQLVVALVKPSAYSSSRSTGHYVTVTGIKDGKVIVNDPAQQTPNRVIDARAFQRAMDAKGGQIVAIGA